MILAIPFKDVGSETKKRRELLDLAKAGQIQLVVVTDLSQWGRSIPDLAQTVKKLHDCDVPLLCLDEFNCNPQTNQGHLVLNIINLFAKFDNELLSEQKRFDRSFINIFNKTDWFILKLLTNIFFAITSAVLLLTQDTVIKGLSCTIASVFISNLLNSFDSLMVPKHKR